MKNEIINRILNASGDYNLLERLLGMPSSDLNSLFLELFRQKSDGISPEGLLKKYEDNRFVKPAEVNPAEFNRFAAELLELSEKFNIKGILLSPSGLFGSCSAFGCVDQNNVLSALRGTETLSDPTNMLAIILADQLKRRVVKNESPIHYCTATRVVRAQKFEGAHFFAHFGIFCMVSSGKDNGSYHCEKALLLKHLEYYMALLAQKCRGELSLTLRKRSGYTDSDGFFEAMSAMIKAAFPETKIEYDLEHEDNLYYKGINFKIYLLKDDEKIEIGDGGFVDWISRMTTNKKERCLISGIGMERLMMFGDKSCK